MEFIEEYLVTTALSENTKKNYTSTLSKYFQSEKDIDEILDLQLSEAIAWVKERANTTSDKTLNEHFNRIRSFLAWYKGINNVTTKYDLSALNHKYVNTTNPIILLDKEIAVAMLAMNPAEKATFMAYLHTGVRKDEIKYLTPQDFLEKKAINVYGEKTNTERTVYTISDELEKLIKEHDIKSFVKPYVLTEKFKRIKNENDIYITFNILRHTFATNYIDHGGNAYRLARVLGNSVETVLTNYYHNNTTKTREEMDNIINKRTSLKTTKAYIEYLEARVKELEDK